MTIKTSVSNYSRVEGIHIIDYEEKTTYNSYTFKERFALISQMFINPSCEGFWKRFKIALLGYEIIDSNKTIKSVRKIPAPDSLKGPLFRMTYSHSELNPMKYENPFARYS